jgi:hypothetical protein
MVALEDSNLRPMDYEGSDRLELFRAVDLLTVIAMKTYTYRTVILTLNYFFFQ